jgi:hypothetical protein
MRQMATFPPDLLRRFAPTPYVFTLFNGAKRIWIEANDLEIALCVRRFCILDSKRKQPCVLSWKLIRDDAAFLGEAELLILVNGPLRTLHLGTGTIIIYDVERLELLCFISHNVTAEYLMGVLIPLLTEVSDTDGLLPSEFLQINDKQHIT